MQPCLPIQLYILYESSFWRAFIFKLAAWPFQHPGRSARAHSRTPSLSFSHTHTHIHTQPCLPHLAHSSAHWLTDWLTVASATTTTIRLIIVPTSSLPVNRTTVTHCHFYCHSPHCLWKNHCLLLPLSNRKAFLFINLTQGVWVRLCYQSLLFVLLAGY